MRALCILGHFKHPVVKPSTASELQEISDSLGLKCTEDEIKEFRGMHEFNNSFLFIIYLPICCTGTNYFFFIGVQWERGLNQNDRSKYNYCHLLPVTCIVPPL